MLFSTSPTVARTCRSVSTLLVKFYISFSSALTILLHWNKYNLYQGTTNFLWHQSLAHKFKAKNILPLWIYSVITNKLKPSTTALVHIVCASNISSDIHKHFWHNTTSTYFSVTTTITNTLKTITKLKNQSLTHTPIHKLILTFSHRDLNGYSPSSRTTLFSLGI